jgi:hypothetical protein
MNDIQRAQKKRYRARLQARHPNFYGHPLYGVWMGMLDRCTRPQSPKYPRYGGRGIRVCDRWLHSFQDFTADVGDRPPGLTLDRIDNNGHYEPGNVRWATRVAQIINSTNHVKPRLIEFAGEALYVRQWARKLNIPDSTLSARLCAGWGVEKALTQPINTSFRSLKRQALDTK